MCVYTYIYIYIYKQYIYIYIYIYTHNIPASRSTDARALCEAGSSLSG